MGSSFDTKIDIVCPTFIAPADCLAALELTEIESLRRILDDFRISMAEYVMLNFLRFENRPARDAPGYALGLLRKTRLGPFLPTEVECVDAMDQLCGCGLTQIVTRDALKQIVGYLSQYNGVGPTAGLPLVGELDFTLEGADLWRTILNFKSDDFKKDHYWYSSGAFIYRRNATILIGYDLLEVLHEVKCCEFISVAPYERIETWRTQWWREIPSGYLVRCRPST